jgi:N-acyl-D-aspartate/D-glutamate deacylase
MIDKARTAGRAVACDAYPYVAMWTGLATILPPDVRSGGTEATLARLRDPKTATAIQLALSLANEAEDWHAMLVTDAGDGRNAELAGMRIDEIAAARRLSPALTVIQLLIEERLAIDCAFFTMTEDDVATVLSADFCAIGSDASARAFSGVTAVGRPHPRTFGCFPRVFGRFVRGRRTLTLEDAVRRMTSLPARLFNLRGRGTIAAGAYADLVVFDPDTIVDRATYDQPYAAPEGIQHVLVNGVFALRDGRTTGARSGRVLRSGGAT